MMLILCFLFLFLFCFRLMGNPACTNAPVLSTLGYCGIKPQQAYSTPIECGGALCPSDRKLNPGSCTCALPYEGKLTFKAPSFSDLSNDTLFQSLELDLWQTLNLTKNSVSLQNIIMDNSSYLIVPVSFFPSDGTYFSRSDIAKIGFVMTNHTFEQPPGFGPYTFSTLPYPYPGNSISSSHVSGLTIIHIRFDMNNRSSWRNTLQHRRHGRDCRWMLSPGSWTCVVSNIR